MNEFKVWESSVPMEVGDKFTMEVSLKTKWNRFLYWLIKKPIPTEIQTFEVTHSN